MSTPSNAIVLSAFKHMLLAFLQMFGIVMILIIFGIKGDDLKNAIIGTVFILCISNCVSWMFNIEMFG